ncbi:MAG TPA: hypothetical protein VF625_10990 [Longimicrobium sp.]|jgi:hypothetical protein
MRKQIAVTMLFVVAGCSETPTASHTEVRAVGALGATRDAAVESGGMFGSGHKTGAQVVSDSLASGACSDAGGGMFGSGH